MINSVMALLLQLDGTHENVVKIRRAVLRSSRLVPSDHHLHVEIDDFLSEVELVALSLRIGGQIDTILPHLEHSWTNLNTKIGQFYAH